MDDVLPQQSVRQWVLSLPFALCYLLATRPEVVTQVLGIVYRVISGPSDSQSRPDARERGDRGGDPDTAIRQCAQSKHSLPHAVPRQGLFIRSSAADISSRVTANGHRARSATAPPQRPGGQAAGATRAPRPRLNLTRFHCLRPYRRKLRPTPSIAPISPVATGRCPA